ncbi:hypothetical protein AMTR_s00065p00020910 [Amborella trichopoda]|uniref:Uncharacterized protein n=2 Tax=Amborella trichopoda TaxID=13333 RepID=U5DAP4_AMBTC|nr:hypothetical protein AMTR_s00065p00020910 [Amborella trichopoda]
MMGSLKKISLYNQVRLSDSGGYEFSCSVIHLIDNHEVSELDNVKTAVEAECSKTLALENATHTEYPGIVRNSGRKLWKRLRGFKRPIESEVSARRLAKTEQCPSLDRKDGDSLSSTESELEAKLSTLEPLSSIENCNNYLKLLEKSNDAKALQLFEWMKSNGKLDRNPTAYNLALRVLSRKEDWKASEELLREMPTVSNCSPSSQMFNTLIYVCSKRELVGWGTKWFRMMLYCGVKPNQATIGMLMSLYQKGGNLEEAEFTLGQMRTHGLHCCVAYSAMMTIYTRLGLYEKSEEILKTMREDRVPPNLENWLVQLNVYSQQGKLEEAELVLLSMKRSGISPNIIAYNTLITGYGKMGKTEASRRVFRDLCNNGFEPDETTYRSMIEGYGRADEYKEAIWYYQELKHKGFCPNSSNFFTVINLQGKHMDDEGTVQTLKDMREMGGQYSSILGSLLRAYERVERVDKVPLILKASFYESLLSDPTSCSILALAYVKHGLLDDALAVLWEKKWSDPIFEDNLCHLLICTCKEERCFENAVKIFTQMPKTYTNPNMHITSTMIDIYSGMGLFKKAEDLYHSLKASGKSLDLVGYSIVVRMYMKYGYLTDACLVLEIMEKQKNISPDIYLYFDMLRIYQQGAMLDKLADVYYRMLKSGIVWDEQVYNCVINCCGHAIPVDELSRLFRKMTAAGFAANTNSFNVLIDVYTKAGLFKRARKVLWMARRRKMVDAISYNTIITAYGKDKQFRRMKSASKQMQYAGFPVSLAAYNAMLDAYGKGGEIDKFREVLEQMKEANCALDHYTYNIMINIYGKKGWIEDVVAVLGELKKHELEPDLWSYNALIEAYGIARMVEEAVYLVKEMRDNGIEPDQVTYVNVIRALKNNGHVLEAIKWSLWMKQLGLSSRNN